MVTFFTIIALCFSSTQVANAADVGNVSFELVEADLSYKVISENIKLYDGMTEAELEQKIYQSLSPEAKALYDSVDVNGKVNSQIINKQAAGTASSAYTQLIRDLTALGLPTAVFNSLKAAAASLVAAADGPLPVGDILAVLSAVTLVTVVALNWNEVTPKWNKIVTAFKKAFATSSKNITSAFSTTKTQIDE